MSFCKPLSLSEQRKLAEQLRKESEEKIAEAERIEESINSYTKTMLDTAKKPAFGGGDRDE